MTLEQYKKYKRSFYAKNLRLPSTLNLVEEFGIRIDEAEDLRKRYERQIFTDRQERRKAKVAALAGSLADSNGVTE